MIRNDIKGAMQDLEICNYWINQYQNIPLDELNAMLIVEQNNLVKMSIEFLIKQKLNFENRGDVLNTAGYIL
jgi:hypothetical protein